MQLSVAVVDVWKLLKPCLSCFWLWSVLYQVATYHRSLIPGIWALSQFLSSIKRQWPLLYCDGISNSKSKLTYTFLWEMVLQRKPWPVLRPQTEAGWERYTCSVGLGKWLAECPKHHFIYSVSFSLLIMRLLK